jgi:hypothetical protein
MNNNFFKTSFTNTETVKFSVTQITQTPSEYWDLLNNISGDVFQNNGVNFNKLVLHSLHYFFTNCINSSDLVDSDWSLEFAKSILDKNNDTGWQPVTTSPHCSNIEVYKKDYYKECFAFIQLAYYLNHIDLTKNQYFEYIDHYLTTGSKLPDDNYKLDLAYLKKKYNEYDKSKGDHKTTAKTTLKNHFYGCLFILCNDLGLSIKNFKIDSKQGRDYSPIVKVPREFRKYFPFILVENDIIAAYPHFIDLQIDSNCAAGIYEKFAASLNVTRTEAKILFNKTLNSGKYHPREFFVKFFEPVYKDKTEALVDLVMDSSRPFWMVMQHWEFNAIETYKTKNKIQNVTRLHDAVILIDNIYSNNRQNIFINYTFGSKKLNSFADGLQFEVSKKTSKFNYISSLPSSLSGYKNAEHHHESQKEIFKSKNFDIYKDDFHYIKAGFNIASRGNFYKDDFIHITDDIFLKKVTNQIAVLIYLNDNINHQNLSHIINTVVNYIFDNGVFSFNKNYLVNYLMDLFESEVIEPEWKIKNWMYKGTEQKNNFTIYQWSSLLYEAKSKAKEYFAAQDLHEIINSSLHSKEKIYINIKDLGIKDKRTSPRIAAIVDSFNGANGIDCLRFANTLHDLCTKFGTLYSDVYNRVTKLVHTPSQNQVSKDLSINRRTAKKLIDWMQLEPDTTKIKQLEQQLSEIIEHQKPPAAADKPTIPTPSWNEAFNIETETTITNKVDDVIYINIISEYKPAPAAVQYVNSVLNCNFDKVMAKDSNWILDWYLFNNNTIPEQDRQLLKNNVTKSFDYIMNQYNTGQKFEWNRAAFNGLQIAS